MSNYRGRAASRAAGGGAGRQGGGSHRGSSHPEQAMPSDARGRCRGIRLCVLRERAAGRRSTLRFRAKEGARCGRRSADHSKRFKWRAFHRQPLAGLGTSGQRKSFPGVSGSGGGGSSVGGASGVPASHRALQKDRASSGAVGACRPAIFRTTGADPSPSRFPAAHAEILATVLYSCRGCAGAAVLGCWPWARPPALLHLAQGVHGARARAGAAAAAARHLARHRLLLPHAGQRLGYMKARAEGMDSGPFDIAYHSYAAVCSLIRHDFAGYMGTRPRLQRRCRALLARSDLGLAEWTGAPPQSQGRCASTPWRARAPARVARSTLGCPALRSITRASPPATNSMRGPPRTLQSCGAAHPALLLTCLPPRTLSTVGAVDGRTQGSVHSASRHLPPENRGGD